MLFGMSQNSGSAALIGFAQGLLFSAAVFARMESRSAFSGCVRTFSLLTFASLLYRHNTTLKSA